MNSTAILATMAVLVPLALTAMAWRFCGHKAPVAALTGGFVIGALAVWPAIRLGNVITAGFTGVIGHYYLRELLEQTWATSLPEEACKGLVVLLVVWLAGTPASPLAWIACGVAVHGGFAALEGGLGALGNEGILKVVVGRSLGSLSHCSWGIIMAWFLWKSWVRRGGAWGYRVAAFLVPLSLHAITNASLVEIPGSADLPDGTMPPLAFIPIMLSGVAATIASFALAGMGLAGSRRIDARSERLQQRDAEMGAAGIDPELRFDC